MATIKTWPACSQGDKKRERMANSKVVVEKSEKKSKY